MYPAGYLFNYTIPLNKELSTFECEIKVLMERNSLAKGLRTRVRVCVYLVTEQDVYACRTLSVHLVDRSQWKAAHTRHLADQFCSCELL